MKRTGPALLIVGMLLSACAAEEPRQPHFHANWLAEGPRTVRVMVGAPTGEPLYSVVGGDVGRSALGGAGVGLFIGSIITGGGFVACDLECARPVAAFIGGAVVIGAVIGAVGSQGEILRSFPLEDREATRPLAPVMRQTGQDIVRRAVEMFAENLRQDGGHAVTIAEAGEAGEAGAGTAESEIELTLYNIGLVGPGSRKSTRASLRIAIQVRARWRGSSHTQNFQYKTEAADLDDWADPGGAVAEQATRLAALNLAGKIFDALAEP